MPTTFQFKRRIRFADTNQSGSVHFDVYVRLMEETEYAFLRSRGLRVVLNDGKGIFGFPRLNAELQILEPLVLDEITETTLYLDAENGKSIVYQFEVRCQERLAATGKYEVACCRFPPDGENPYAILIPNFVLEKLSA